MRSPRWIRAFLFFSLALSAGESVFAATPRAIDNNADLFWPPVTQPQAATSQFPAAQAGTPSAPLVPITSPAQRNAKFAETVKAANALAAKLLKLDFDAQRQFAQEHPGALPKLEL